MDKTLTSAPHCLAMMALCAGVIATPASATDEGYYTTEIDQAVEYAQQNPVRPELIGDTWYDRSTFKSFALPTLANEVMDNQVIEGAMGPTAAGEAAAADAGRPIRQAALGRTRKDGVLEEGSERSPSNAADVEADKNDLIMEEVSSTTNSGRSRVSQVRGSVTIRTRATP